MSEHTKEPWKLCEVGDKRKHLCPASQDDTSILTVALEYDDDGEPTYFGAVYNPDDARRIVACVNACAGISDETLAEWGKPGGPGMWGRAASRIQAQCDGMLAALQMALADHMTEAYLHPLRDGTVEAIRCAIANAEKEERCPTTR